MLTKNQYTDYRVTFWCSCFALLSTPKNSDWAVSVTPQSIEETSERSAFSFVVSSSLTSLQNCRPLSMGTLALYSAPAWKKSSLLSDWVSEWVVWPFKKYLFFPSPASKLPKCNHYIILALRSRLWIADDVLRRPFRRCYWYCIMYEYVCTSAPSKLLLSESFNWRSRSHFVVCDTFFGVNSLQLPS